MGDTIVHLYHSPKMNSENFVYFHDCCGKLHRRAHNLGASGLWDYNNDSEEIYATEKKKD